MYINKNLNWDNLSRNVNINDIERNLDLDWNWYWISYNPNIKLDFVKKYKHENLSLSKMH